jgi:transposase
VAYIFVEPARYVCNHCKKQPTTTQQSSWYEQGFSYTKKYTEYILLSLINSTIKDVCIKENIGYDVIEGMIERNINDHVDWDEIKTLGVIGIDEISIKKGHQDFVVIVTGIINGNLRILAVLKDRKKATVKKFSIHSKGFKKTG